MVMCTPSFIFFWEHKDPHFKSDFLHVLPLFVLWTLWTQRNQVLYDCSTTSAAAVRSLQILLRQVSFSRPFKLLGSVLPQGLEFLHFKSRVRRTCVVSWVPSDTYKLNVDGSSLLEHKRGLSCVTLSGILLLLHVSILAQDQVCGLNF